MSLLSTFLANTPPVPSLDWAGVAARPGSGLGFLPAALSVQPGVTLATLALAGLAAVLAPHRDRRPFTGRNRRRQPPQGAAPPHPIPSSGS